MFPRNAWLAVVLGLASVAAQAEPAVIVFDSATLREVAPDAAGQLPEFVGATRAALDSAFIEFDVADEAITDEALEGYAVAVFPYNRYTEAESAAIERFVTAGGRIVTFFVASDEIWALHGLRSGQYLAAEGDLRLAGWVCDEGALPGAPAEVTQEDWGLIPVSPAEGAEVRTAAEWVGPDGRRTGHAAAVLTPAGCHVTHVLLGDDPERKGGFLLAVLEGLRPGLVAHSAERARTHATRLAPYADLDGLRDAVERMGRTQAASATLGAVAAAEARFAAAGQGAGWEAFAAARDLGAAARELYSYTLESPECEARAVWTWSSYDEPWPVIAKRLREAGVNLVIPWTCSSGYAYYQSEVLPHHADIADGSDKLRECVEACHAEGIDVHAWKVNWRVMPASPKPWREQLEREGRFQVNRQGKPETTWLCPSDDRNFQLEVDAMCEMAEEYDVDGVSYDYIRYEYLDHCFCDRCRAKFEQRLGSKVADWPEDCFREGAVREAWLEFRQDNVSRVVQAVSERLARTRPDCVISGAVFQNWEDHRSSFGQDWVKWLREGWLDVAIPMTYQNADDLMRRYANRQVGWVAGEAPLVVGLGPHGTGTTFRDAHQLLEQVRSCRELGSDGWALFMLNADLERRFLGPLRNGAASRPAHLPWEAPIAEFTIGDEGVVDSEGPVPVYRAGDRLDVGVTVTTEAPFVDGVVTQVEGDWVLETADRRTLAWLGEFSTADRQTLEGQCRPPAGVCRPVLHGAMTLANGERRPFTVRGPLVELIHRWGGR